MSDIRVPATIRDAVGQLVGELPPGGMSTRALARIGRMRLEVVEAALLQLEVSGVVMSVVILDHGEVVKLWRRR